MAIREPPPAPEPAAETAVEEPSPSYYEPMDLAFVRQMIERYFGPIMEAYFRPRLIHGELLPARGPAILAANHSGSAFPYDGMVLDGLLWQRSGMRPEAKYRSVYEKTLSATWWMRPWGIDNFWRRCGGVDITFDNFDRLLGRGERLIYYPEGVPGIGKGFARRYQLQPFATSFVTVASRHRAPVHPIYIINAEWVIPFSFTFRPLDRLMQRFFKVPFLPLPAGPLAIVFPFLWYLALPARMIYVAGRPIDVAELVRRAGGDPDAPDRETARRVADEIRDRMQARLTGLVERYGRWPYQLRLLGQRFWRRRGRWFELGPWGWPWCFVRHERDRWRPAARNRLHAVARDWDLLFYYLPLGWALLSLTRRFRRPPCGYRGLSDAERRQREGNFRWHLAERPLPPRQPPRAEPGSVAG